MAIEPISPIQSNNATNKEGKSGNKKRFDEQSKFGRFGWYEIEKCVIPFIFRAEQKDKYVPIQIIEAKLLSRFTGILPPDIIRLAASGLLAKGRMQSYSMTETEVRLINEINIRHSDGSFGNIPFTTKDLVIKLSDAEEFYHFLQLCYKKSILKRSSPLDRCGFFRINGKRSIPFTKCMSAKYVPLFYFNGGDESDMKKHHIDGWDLAYLKYCCFVQGVKKDLFESDIIQQVVEIDDLRSQFPVYTVFEDYWPGDDVDEQLDDDDDDSNKHVSNQKVLQVLDEVLSMEGEESD